MTLSKPREYSGFPHRLAGVEGLRQAGLFKGSRCLTPENELDSPLSDDGRLANLSERISARIRKQ